MLNIEGEKAGWHRNQLEGKERKLRRIYCLGDCTNKFRARELKGLVFRGANDKTRRAITLGYIPVCRVVLILKQLDTITGLYLQQSRRSHR